MKGKPVRLTPHDGYVECHADDATHLSFCMPGPAGLLTLPVIRTGTRDGTNCWTWNGSTQAPTLRPSVLTQGTRAGVAFRCHVWVNDGLVQFLDDCSHEFRGQTLSLVPFESEDQP